MFPPGHDALMTCRSIVLRQVGTWGATGAPQDFFPIGTWRGEPRPERDPWRFGGGAGTGRVSRGRAAGGTARPRRMSGDGPPHPPCARPMSGRPPCAAPPAVSRSSGSRPAAGPSTPSSPRRAALPALPTVDAPPGRAAAPHRLLHRGFAAALPSACPGAGLPRVDLFGCFGWLSWRLTDLAANVVFRYPTETWPPGAGHPTPNPEGARRPGNRGPSRAGGGRRRAAMG